MKTLFKGLVLLPFLMLSPSWAQFWNDFEEPPHHYLSHDLKDPVSSFLAKLNRGEIAVNEANGKPLLTRLLKEFEIPKSSQVLVFTKTSLQRDQVSAQNPRALYFNEDVYLGWMPGARIEVASIEPTVGPIFYLQRPLDRSKDRLFRRNRGCLGCHAGSATNFIPGLLGQSTYPTLSGRSVGVVRTFERVGHDIPYQERWGGWMVTGLGLERLPHMANAIATRTPGGGHQLERKTEGAKAQDLDVFFPHTTHLVPGSDFLAMLAHDHQISAHYYMNVAQYKLRQALFDNQMAQDSGNETFALMKRSSKKDIDESIGWLLRYFLFANEAPLGGNVIQGHGKYRVDFMANKRVSRSGKSLKDLDLKDRFLKYRLSYMIYSNAFEGLQKALKDEFYTQLWIILTEPEGVKGYKHLSEEEKAAIIEIVADTKKGLPKIWRVGNSTN